MPVLSSATFTHAATGGTLNRFHVDPGFRAALPDALGRSWFDCDARGFVLIPSFDLMHRPLSAAVALRGDGNAVASRSAYGECLPLAQALNLRGRVLECFTQAGWAMARGMSAVAISGLDGACPQNAGLQTTGYSSALQRRDALGRMLETADSFGHVLRYAWLRSGMPDAVSVDVTCYLSSFACNARAQLLSIGKGPGEVIASTFQYD